MSGIVRDLLVMTHTPVLRSGRAVRTYGVARALAVHRGLDLLYARFGGDSPDAAFASIPGVRLQEVVASRGARRAAAYARGRLAGVPDGIARGISSELAAAAAELAGEAGRGRVIADGPEAAATLAALARRRPVVYNAHNFESGFRHELGGEGSARLLRAFERRLLARAAESWMVSEADLAAARALCPQASLRYVPNVVDAAAIEPVRPLPDTRRAIFVANFAYEPNRVGLRFMLEDVLPRVWRELPDAELTLVGAGLEAPPVADERVRVRGFVEDLRDAYGGARCAVVPLLVGGGTPLKLIEALAYGMPVLATPRAVAGLSVTAGVDCVIADGAAAFAAELARLLARGAQDIGDAGRRLAVERYSIEALAKLLAPA